MGRYVRKNPKHAPLCLGRAYWGHCDRPTHHESGFCPTHRKQAELPVYFELQAYNTYVKLIRVMHYTNLYERTPRNWFTAGGKHQWGAEVEDK